MLCVVLLVDDKKKDKLHWQTFDFMKNLLENIVFTY